MGEVKLVQLPKDWKDTRSCKEICDEIDYESASLSYLSHRTIQEDLCELHERLKLAKEGWWNEDGKAD